MGADAVMEILGRGAIGGAIACRPMIMAGGGIPESPIATKMGQQSR